MAKYLFLEGGGPSAIAAAEMSIRASLDWEKFIFVDRDSLRREMLHDTFPNSSVIGEPTSWDELIKELAEIDEDVYFMPCCEHTADDFASRYEALGKPSYIKGVLSSKLYRRLYDKFETSRAVTGILGAGDGLFSWGHSRQLAKPRFGTGSKYQILLEPRGEITGSVHEMVYSPLITGREFVTEALLWPNGYLETHSREVDAMVGGEDAVFTTVATTDHMHEELLVRSRACLEALHAEHGIYNLQFIKHDTHFPLLIDAAARLGGTSSFVSAIIGHNFIENWMQMVNGGLTILQKPTKAHKVRMGRAVERITICES